MNIYELTSQIGEKSREVMLLLNEIDKLKFQRFQQYSEGKIENKTVDGDTLTHQSWTEDFVDEDSGEVISIDRIKNHFYNGMRVFPSTMKQSIENKIVVESMWIVVDESVKRLENNIVDITKFLQ